MNHLGSLPSSYEFMYDAFKSEGLDELASEMGVFDQQHTMAVPKDNFEPLFHTPLMSGLQSPTKGSHAQASSHDKGAVKTKHNVHKRRKTRQLQTTIPYSSTKKQTTVERPLRGYPQSVSSSTALSSAPPSNFLKTPPTVGVPLARTGVNAVASSSSSSPSSTAAASSSSSGTTTTPLPPGTSGFSSSSSAASSTAQAKPTEDVYRLKLPTKVRASSGANKGLRHFSLKVCEKVELKKVTTYNEVAECLVQELSNPDEKNIRRRVYDALNVLMAMGIITKNKKTITWVGLPGGVTQDVRQLSREKTTRLDRIRRKRQHLSNLLQEMVCFRNLVEKNSNAPGGDRAKLGLPYVLVHTAKDTVIQLEMTEDRRQVFFNFNDAFNVKDDKDVMKTMGLSLVEPWDLARIVPRELVSFYPGDSLIQDDDRTRTLAPSVHDSPGASSVHGAAPVTPNYAPHVGRSPAKSSPFTRTPPRTPLSSS